MVEVDKFNLIENDSAVSEKFKDKNFFPVAMSFIRNVLEDNTFITEYEDDHKEYVKVTMADGRVIQIPKLDLESRLVQKQNIFSPVSY